MTSMHLNIHPHYKHKAMIEFKRWPLLSKNIAMKWKSLNKAKKKKKKGKRNAGHDYV